MGFGLKKVMVNPGRCGGKAHVMEWLPNDCAISISHPAYRGVLNSPVKTVRDTLITQCAQILACYRKNCASPSSAGQVGKHVGGGVVGTNVCIWEGFLMIIVFILITTFS